MAYSHLANSHGLRQNRDSLWRGNGWRIDTLAPLVTIGTQSGGPAYELHGVSSVIRTSAGGFAISESSELGTSIKLFDARGRFIRELGRRGQGPGEFMNITSLARLAADSIFVYDMIQRRITVFDSGGRTSRTVRVLGEGLPALTNLKPLADGSLVGAFVAGQTAGRPSGGQPYHVRDTLVIVRLDTASNSLSRIAALPNADMLMHGTVGLYHRYTLGAYWDVQGSTIWAASNDSVAIAGYSADGRRLRVLGAAVLNVPLERDSIAAEQERWRGQVQRGGAAATFASIRLANARFPNFRPRFQEVLAGPDGNLWLKVPRSQDRIVIRSDGQLLGTIRIPASRRLLLVGDSWVLTSRFDSLDIPRVELLRISK